MTFPLDDQAKRQLFTDARSQNAWLDKPVSDSVLQEIFELAKWGPTSMNCSPMRVVFVRTQTERARLLMAVSPGNQIKVQTAPVVAIVAYDTSFHDNLPKLFPHRPEAANLFSGNAGLADTTAFRNGSLQGAYLILAARTLGLDCGPLSGFDEDKVNELFFHQSPLKVNFLCCLGYGDSRGLFARSPRLSFAEVCELR